MRVVCGHAILFRLALLSLQYFSDNSLRVPTCARPHDTRARLRTQPSAALTGDCTLGLCSGSARVRHSMGADAAFAVPVCQPHGPRRFLDVTGGGAGGGPYDEPPHRVVMGASMLR